MVTLFLYPCFDTYTQTNIGRYLDCWWDQGDSPYELTNNTDWECYLERKKSQYLRKRRWP